MPPPYDLLLIAATLVALLWLALARRRDSRRAQALLAQQAARHAATLGAASEAIVALDGANRIVTMNPAAEQLLGVPAERALGRSFADFVPPELRARQAEMLAQFVHGDALAVSVDSRIETPVLRADGRRVEVEVSVSRSEEPGSGGRRFHYTLILRDVTEQRAALRELHRLGERYRTIVEQSPDAIWLAEGGRLRIVNAACVALLGARSADDLLGRELDAVLGSGVVADAPRPHPTRVLRLRRLDGALVDVEITVADVPDHGEGALQGVMRDVTWRLQAEAELRATQHALEQSQQIARLGYATLDVAAGRWTISSSLAEVLGVPGSTALDLEAGWRLVHPEDREALRWHIMNEVLTGREPFDREYRILRASDGEERWLHAIGRTERDAAGQVVRLFATLQDVTARKLATLALERSREELSRLSASVIWAREGERRRVARELHDELGQRLSVLKLDLAALRGHAAAGAAGTSGAASAASAADTSGAAVALGTAGRSDAAGAANSAGAADAADAADSTLEQLARGIDDALAATRRIAADLRPAMLDDLGLSAALEWLAEGWSRRTGVTITVEGDPIDDRLSEAGAITVYRIVQEALTNIARHAQAQHVQVELRREGGALVVAVDDDGRGLAPGDADKRSSSGLAGIRERARILGGEASVANRPAGGTRLEVRLPLTRVDSGLATLDAAEAHG
jgi:PAS domain S-box-containing protein